LSSSEEEDTQELIKTFKIKVFMDKVDTETDPDLYPNSQIKYKYFVAMVVRVFEHLNISGRLKIS
jgi:hypothetical protein